MARGELRRPCARPILDFVEAPKKGQPMANLFHPPIRRALDPSVCVLAAADAALSLQNNALCADLIEAAYSYFSDDADHACALENPGYLRDTDIAEAMKTGARTASLLTSLFTRSVDLRRWDSLINALDVAIYSTDEAGRLTHYNNAAMMFWGWQPICQQQAYCGSWRLLEPDGSDLAHDKSPMAICLNEKRAVRGQWKVAQQPGGARQPFAAFPTPIFDQSGRFVGGFSVLVELSHAEAQAALQAA